MHLKEPLVFITGSTGFIGGRIAERLWIDCNVMSHCLVKNFGKAARLARLPVKMFRGDVLDAFSVQKAMEGCNVVFHCAYGNTKDTKLNRLINEQGTRNICEVALKMNVRRVIFFSSVAVYGPRPQTYVNEETPTVFSEDEYANSKIRAEAICREFIKKDLPLTIIRPTIVFGPFSPIWTIGAINRVIAEGWENIRGIKGICNPVYIDDLVDAAFLVVRNEKAVGETFIISGDSAITWNEFYGTYMTAANLSMAPEISEEKMRIKNIFRNSSRLIISFLRKYFEPQLFEIYISMKERNPSLTEKVEHAIRGGIRNNELDRFSLETYFRIDKAKRMIGYEPKPFLEGMETTTSWLKHHEYI